jgi:hypothetical protein
MPVCVSLKKCPKTRDNTRNQHFYWDYEKRSVTSYIHLSSIVAHNARLANLSNSHDPAFQLFNTIATRYRQATQCDTLADPVHYIQRYAPHATSYSMTGHSTAHRAGIGQGVSLRNLLFIGGRDGMTGVTHDAWLAQLQMRKTPLPRKTPYFPLSALFRPMQLRWPLLIKCCNHPLEICVIDFCNLESCNYRLR